MNIARTDTPHRAAGSRRRPFGTTQRWLLLACGLTALAIANAVPAPAAEVGQREQQQQQGGQEQAVAARPAERDLEGGDWIDRILVRVNGEPILLSDFEEEYEARLGVIEGQIPAAQLEAQLPQLRLAVLDGLVTERLLEQRAGELGITASATQIDRGIANMMEQTGIATLEEFEQALAAEGLSMADFRDRMGKAIVQEILTTEEVQRQIFVSESEIEEYYEVNRNRFRDPTQVLLQQVIFTYEAANKESMQSTAEAALAELRAGVSLTSVAAKYEGAQAMGGDSADWISPEDMRPELAAAVEGLTPGAYSDVIETPFAFFVLQVMDRRDETVMTLEEASAEIRQTLLIQKREQGLQRYQAELRMEAHLEVLAEEFQPLAEQWENARAADPAGRRR